MSACAFILFEFACQILRFMFQYLMLEKFFCFACINATLFVALVAGFA